jgi:F-type H+-transporting ATPase subunit a
MLKRSLSLLFLAFALCFSSVAAESVEESGNEFQAVFHHISDDYKWHIIGDLNIYLPVIVYSPESGLDIFSSSRFREQETVNGYKYHHGKLTRADGASFYDFSFTKNVAAIFFSVIFISVIFISIANRYKKYQNQAPKGLQSLLEPIIIFVRDDIAKMAIGEHKYMKYVPFLLSIFFFIWINNLLGLIPIFPGATNITGNISITLTLAAFSFFAINLSGNKHYWQHILWPPGIPTPVKPILAIVEILGIFIKPFALMIRLFANIAAGHVVLLSLVTMIFVFSNMLGPIGTGGVSVVAVLFTLFMYCLELLVAVLQAYIFTILTALFIGQAVEEPAHH